MRAGVGVQKVDLNRGNNKARPDQTKPNQNRPNQKKTEPRKEKSRDEQKQDQTGPVKARKS